MTAKSFSMTSALLMTFSLSTAQLASSKSAHIPAAADTRATLKEIDEVALKVADDADQLRMLIDNTEFSWQAHSERLMDLKDDVNRMGREVNSLEAERGSLTPGEQQDLDKALVLVNETAAETQKAIKYFDNNQTRLWTADYREYANDIWRDSEQIAKTLSDRLKYEKVHEQEQQLELRVGGAGN
jgi:hypothetical protein